MSILLKVNGQYSVTLAGTEAAPNSENSVSVSNYMYDISPGTYTFQFSAQVPWIDGTQPSYARARSTSIIMVPR